MRNSYRETWVTRPLLFISLEPLELVPFSVFSKHSLGTAQTDLGLEASLPGDAVIGAHLESSLPLRLGFLSSAFLVPAPL